LGLKTKKPCLETTLQLCSRTKTNLKKHKLTKQNKKVKNQKFHQFLDLEEAQVFLEMEVDYLAKLPHKKPKNKSLKRKLSQSPSLQSNTNPKLTFLVLLRMIKKTNKKRNQHPLFLQRINLLKLNLNLKSRQPKNHNHPILLRTHKIQISFLVATSHLTVA
jgi:hypothetical protein